MVCLEFVRLKNKFSSISRNLQIPILKLIMYVPLPVLNHNGRAEVLGVKA